MSAVDGPAGTRLTCQRTGATVVLRLDRPAARNALDRALVAELAAALHRLEADLTVRAAVLAGAPPGFCAGSDLKELAALPPAGQVRHEERTGELVRAIPRLRFPVVCAVDGFALGGGFLLAAACDIVVTDPGARWHLPEVGLGWVPPWGLHALTGRVGPVVARRLGWGVEPMTGQQAYRLGAADELAAPGRVLVHAIAVAARLAGLPPHAVAAIKRVTAGPAGQSAAALDRHTTRLFGAHCQTATARDSLAQFARQRSTEDR